MLVQPVLAVALALFLASGPLFGGPSVVPTAEGQIGEVPGATDQLRGTRFESIRGAPGDVIFGGLFVFGGAMPPPPEAQFLTDSFHGIPNPVPVGGTPSLFTSVDGLAPDSSWSRNTADDGDFVAFSFAVDGSMPETLTVRVATFDETGTATAEVPIVEDVATFTFFPDPTFAKTGVAVDRQGRATVAFTEFDEGLPGVRAVRVDASGTVLDPAYPVAGAPHADPDVALLDPAGNRLVVVTNRLVNPPGVFGSIVDNTGPSPVVGSEFQVDSTVAGYGNLNPVVAANPVTGEFTVVWDHNTGVVGNPVDVRARRFDAMGDPVGGDFVVNSETANAQGQQDAAYDPAGFSAIAWAGDPLVPMGPDDLDVFLQVYDPNGVPIGGQVQVNTFTEDVQDRPSVRFLPDRDAQGRPQVAVVWRDVGSSDGSSPRGTGTSYRCFSIDGFEEQVPIFEDGFESGDTTSWSDEQP